ncbi:hypothetical protein KFK09_014055 [Dendrobium nobile]|uniref:Retroviral polymerase SH3-like domain-containing protein n=1 Tax=Dendrobium nobile TaxID=94219 RepID=A0A8T3B935_DENNO|nr:hypothetical protein KFK09_014055 [Dendrobium nobile]
MGRRTTSSIYLINHLPTHILHSITPFQKMYIKTPTIAHLKTFSYLCYSWMKPYTKSKLSRLSLPCIFIGYAQSQKGYCYLDIITNCVYVSRHVVFSKKIFPFKQTHSTNNKPSTHPNTTHIPPLLLVPTSLTPMRTLSNFPPQHSLSQILLLSPCSHFRVYHPLNHLLI